MEQIIENGAETAVQMEQAAPAGGAQEMTGPVATLGEILSEAQDSNAQGPDAGGSAAQGETVGNTGDDGPAPAQEQAASTQQPDGFYRSQAEFDAAFSRRMANERARNRPFVEMGQAVLDVAGEELSSDEVTAAISRALAEKRSKANQTDYDTEINNIRVEQRVAQRFAGRPAQQTPSQSADDPGARAHEMLEAMQVIGDEAFNVEALQGNQAAMEAWAGGATPAQVYRQFFLNAPQQPSSPTPTQPARGAAPRSGRPAPERAANSGAMGAPTRTFSAEDIRKIDEYLAKTNGRIPLV